MVVMHLTGRLMHDFYFVVIFVGLLMGLIAVLHHYLLCLLNLRRFLLILNSKWYWYIPFSVDVGNIIGIPVGRRKCRLLPKWGIPQTRGVVNGRG